MNFFEGTKIKFKQLHYYGALLYVFLIPFEQKIVTLSILAWVVASLISHSRDKYIKSWYLALLPLLFVDYMISLMASENQAFTFLESKSSLLAFPFLFFVNRYDKNQRKKILKYFVLGLCLSSLICLLAAVYNSFEIVNNSFVFNPGLEADRGFFESSIYGGNYFFGSHLSLFHQTVYFALYLGVGIALLLFDRSVVSSKRRVALIVFFTLMIFLISNKAGFFSLTFVILFKICTIKYNSARKLVFFGLFFLGIAVFSLSNPRIKESVLRLGRGELVVNKNARYGFSTRLLTWDAALSLIKERPIFGYGIGDAQYNLNNVYEEKGYRLPLKEKFNSHNLFLQLWIENGLLGVLLVLFIFAALLIKALKDDKRRGLFLAIFWILFTSSLFESVFSRFSGISFFSFFICFIFSKSKEDRDNS